MKFLQKFSPNPITQLSAMMIMSSIAIHLLVIAMSIGTGNMKQLLTSAGMIFIMVGALLAMHNIASRVDKPANKTDEAD